MKKEELLKMRYGYSARNKKYTLEGGELAMYVGLPISMITFTRDDEGNWTNKTETVEIKSLSDFNLEDLTWNCKYIVVKENSKPEDEVVVNEVRVLPEGFSFEKGGPEETGKMLKFVPFSRNYMMMEDNNFFSNLEVYWKTKETLNEEFLTSATKASVPEVILSYSHNIGAIVKLNDDLVNPELSESKFLWIRVSKLSYHHINGNKYNLRFSNSDRSWSFVVEKGQTEFDFEGMGTFKLIDLDGE